MYEKGEKFIGNFSWKTCKYISLGDLRGGGRTEKNNL
jgi:hypothetical protein